MVVPRMHRGLPRKRVLTHRPYLCTSTRLCTGCTQAVHMVPPTSHLDPVFPLTAWPLNTVRSLSSPSALLPSSTLTRSPFQPPRSLFRPLALPPTLYRPRCTARLLYRSHASRSQSSGSGGGGPLEEKDGNDGGDAKVGSKKKSVDKKKKKAAEKKKKSLRRL